MAVTCGITPNRLLPAVKINYMTTQNFIDENKTATLKKGDKVIMHGCYEATFEKYKYKVWTCQTDSYTDRAKQEVVFLDGFSGCFAVQYLKPVIS